MDSAQQLFPPDVVRIVVTELSYPGSPSTRSVRGLRRARPKVPA
jgi:hypothetical protein